MPSEAVNRAAARAHAAYLAARDAAREVGKYEPYTRPWCQAVTAAGAATAKLDDEIAALAAAFESEVTDVDLPWR